MVWPAMSLCDEELGGKPTAGFAHARTVVDNLSIMMSDQSADFK
jgi:hypothetical protein